MRYKDLPKVPFTYQPAKGLPGLMAVPITDNSEAVARWQADGADATLAVNYSLTNQSVVFDVGGYLGNWSARIIERYDPFVYIFEPVLEFYQALLKRFSSNPKVRIFNFGLSNADAFAKINKDQDGSSLHRTGAYKETVFLKSIVDFVQQNPISKIDLISINCEGEEYTLLLAMLESGLIRLCNNVQVQFHPDYPNAAFLRDKIRWWLENTHDESYDYPFVWESWKLRQ